MNDRVVAQPRARSLWQGIERVALTTCAQAAIQALALASGLLVLRLLSVREYAYYTLASAAVGMMTVLTDSGVSQSVMAQAGRAWQDRSALGAIMRAGLLLRRKFGAAAAVISLPILFLMLVRHNASTPTALLVTISIIPVVFTTMTGQMLQVVPRLHQRLTALQRILLVTAALRLVLLSICTALYPVAWIATSCVALAQTWGNWRLRASLAPLADLSASADRSAEAAILNQVRRSAPNAIYYAFEGQVTIWLISFFGKAQSIAQVGALSRLVAVFAIVSAVFSMVWVPRFARLAERRVLSQFWSTQAALIVILGAIVGGVALLPHATLAVLGHNYAQLIYEVVLAAAGGALALLAGCAYMLSSSRGVVLTPWILVPVSLCLQVLLIVTLPISTVAGVLWLGILSNLAYWLLHAINFTRASSAKPSGPLGVSSECARPR
jgi:O-antigen/teichoic acid export membrane protein